MISKLGVAFAALFEALKRILLPVMARAREEMKDPSAAWLKLRALMKNGQDSEGSNAFNGLAVSIAIILFGMLGLPLILMSFFW